MVKVKICGITCIEDALFAVEAGANALGFVFYKESKRYIEPPKAGEIISKLPPFLTTVGVFVNQNPNEINEIKEVTGIDAFQLHGNEPPQICREIRGKVIKAIRVKDSIRLKEVEKFPVETILFDTYSPKEFGGTGEHFNWEILRGLKTSKRIILSGGLDPENVAEAIRIVNPYAVDVSSGVEKSPGKKDLEKIKKFIEALRHGT